MFYIASTAVNLVGLLGMVAAIGLWLVLFHQVLGDLFRDPDLSGTAKTGWILLCLVLPILGALIYVVARGSTTGERQLRVTAAEQRAFEAYLREVATTKE